jgi:hypothetical protein
VTVGLSLLVSWLGKSGEASQATQRATQDYADALRDANGVITENVVQTAAKAAQDSGLLDVAQAAGIALPQVTDAITGQGDALDSTRARLEAYIKSHTVAVDATSSDTNATTAYVTTLDSQGKAAQAALDSLNSLAGQNGATATSAQQLAAATAAAGDSSGAAALAQQQLQTELQDTADTASAGRQQIDLLKTALDVLTGDNVSLIQVQASLNDAIAAGMTAIKDEGGAVTRRLRCAGHAHRERPGRRRCPHRHPQPRQRPGSPRWRSRARPPTRSPRPTPSSASRSSTPRSRWASASRTRRTSPTRSSASRPTGTP